VDATVAVAAGASFGWPVLTSPAAATESGRRPTRRGRPPFGRASVDGRRDGDRRSAYLTPRRARGVWPASHPPPRRRGPPADATSTAVSGVSWWCWSRHRRGAPVAAPEPPRARGATPEFSLRVPDHAGPDLACS
jgi:hypothetical protein